MKKKSKRTLTPKLRFPEFRDKGEWEEKHIGEVFQFKQGVQVPVGNQFANKESDMVRFIRIVDLTQESEPVRYIVNPGDEHIIKSNDIFLIRYGTPGVVAIGYEGVIANNLFRIIWRGENKFIPKFWFYIFKNLEEHISNLSASSSMPAISFSALSTLSSIFPTESEQQRIAECLSSLDGLIAAEARKLEALKAHKKGLMQQLFPQPGQSQPRLRFPEFRDKGEWEEKVLSDACLMKAGKFVAASDIKEQDENGLFPCYGGNGLRGFTKSRTHDGIYPLIGRQGALCGNVRLARGEFHATEHAVVATPSKGVDVIWLFYMLDRLYLNRFATGQAQPGLSVDVLEKVTLAVPALEQEQQRIADCLTALDTQITAQAAKIETLKQHKRGLMQQLFPAPEVS